MKVAIICFSLTGWETGEKLKKGFVEKGAEVSLDGKSRYIPDSIKERTEEWAGQKFEDSDALVFIGACGIAVRSIAPYIKKKTGDPAVLVIDECGKFVISLLSGHLGGANELALDASEILHSLPVITTATDLHNRFAVDVFAKKNHCEIFHMKAAKEVSAALLAGKRVGFFSEFPWDGQLPEDLVLCGRHGENMPEVGIAVTIHKSCFPFASTVHVVPPAAVLGMGCRKGKEIFGIKKAAEACIESLDLYQEAIGCLSSIDIKKEEEGLLGLSDEWGIPFVTYNKETLLDVSGEFTESCFVKQVTGVDNVCERSAVLAAEKGRLIQKKTGRDGVTTAVALKDWRMRFE